MWKEGCCFITAKTASEEVEFSIIEVELEEVAQYLFETLPTVFWDTFTLFLIESSM